MSKQLSIIGVREDSFTSRFQLCLNFDQSFFVIILPDIICFALHSSYKNNLRILSPGNSLATDREEVLKVPVEQELDLAVPSLALDLENSVPVSPVSCDFYSDNTINARLAVDTFTHLLHYRRRVLKLLLLLISMATESVPIINSPNGLIFANAITDPALYIIFWCGPMYA